MIGLPSKAAAFKNRSMLWNKVAVLGLGLLGGSIGLGLRKRQAAGIVAAYARREKTVAEGLAAGAADVISTDLMEVVEGADIIILCTPVFQMGNLAGRICSGLKPGAVVTDVGSVKGCVIRDVEEPIRLCGGHFIGSHPMAGSEKTGVQSARADLLVDAACVVTPTPRTHMESLQVLEDFWKALGARVLRMDAATHDELVARSSHLPHVLSAAIAHYVLDPRWPSEQPGLCSTGFRDTSRLASGSPEMWRDICLSNRSAILQALNEWDAELKVFRAALEAADDQKVLDYLISAKSRRDSWVQ